MKKPVGTNNFGLVVLTYCPQHSEEIVTNFCACLQCLKPLCPECMIAHNNWHRSQQTYPQIETLKSVKTQCSKKLSTATKLIQSEIDHIQSSLSFPQTFFEEGFVNLKQYQKRIDQIIDNYFKGLEEQLHQNSQEVRSRSAQFNPTFEQMKTLINELEVLNADMDSAEKDSLQVVRKVCLLDVQHIVGQFQSELNQIAQGINTDFYTAQMEDTRLYYLQEELEKVAYLTMNPAAQQSFQNPSQVPPTPPRGGNDPSFAQVGSSQNNYPQNQGFGGVPSREQFPVNSGAKLGNNPRVSGSLAFMSNEAPPTISDINEEMFSVTAPDYFQKGASRKFLHFFQNDDNKLHIIDLAGLSHLQQIHDYSGVITSVDLKISFKIPSFHKSIATPNGELYLTGGTIPDGTMTKSGFIYQYMWSEEKLIPLSLMNYPRSSHGIAYMTNRIYVVGGYEHKHVMTKRCERYNIKTRKWQLIAPLNFAATSISLCSFNNKYLFKFGGIGEGYQNHLLSPYIERYDVEMDQWKVIDPQLEKISQLNKLGMTFGLLSTSSSVQISPTDILVFGGYHEDNTSSSQTFVLSMRESNGRRHEESDADQEEEDDNFSIRCINLRPLPFAEAFWNNFPIIHNQCVFALQNISGENSDNCLENERQILVFAGQDWIALN